jgi:hypothetical protein
LSLVASSLEILERRRDLSLNTNSLGLIGGEHAFVGVEIDRL